MASRFLRDPALEQDDNEIQATLAGPTSPPPEYSDTAQGASEPLDVDVGTMHTIYVEIGGDDDDSEGDNDSEIEGDGAEYSGRAMRASFVEHLLDAQLSQRPPPKPLQPVPETPFPFMRLPLELREQIYSDYFDPKQRLGSFELDIGPEGRISYTRYTFEFSLLSTCKQVYLEAVNIWRKDNKFMKFQTPWPTVDMVHHISVLGGVPIVAAGSRADMFTQHTSLVAMSVPLHSVFIAENTLVIHSDDIPAFTKVWYYSGLSNAEINPQICLTFTLRDPYYPADPKPVLTALQRKLLLPFGDVKNLYEAKFEECDDDVVTELRKEMAVPYPSIQECCELCASRMEEGDRLFFEKRIPDALEAYKSSFDAIHIKISGRMRRVLADQFFANDIPSGRYAGQAGMTVRVLLRIRLVARMVRTYLHLKQPSEAAFWGLRTIRIMREGEDRGASMETFFTEFMQSSDISQIFMYTATALTQLRQEDRYTEERKEYANHPMAECDHMWRSGVKYLSSAKYAAERKNIFQEVKSFGVTIPDFAKLEDANDSNSDASSMNHLNF